jgi:hypothetical protein
MVPRGHNLLPTAATTKKPGTLYAKGPDFFWSSAAIATIATDLLQRWRPTSYCDLPHTNIAVSFSLHMA